MQAKPTTLADLTDKQLYRVGRNLIRRVYAMGGCEYGWDWPTLRIVNPPLYNSARQILDEEKRRFSLPPIGDINV